MRGSKVSGLFLTFVLIFTAYRTTHAAIHGNKLQSAVLVGTVYCDTCSHQDFSKSSHFISGATVAVECKEWDTSYRREVRTDEDGEFKVKLPFSVHKHVKKLETCSVKLMSSGEEACSVVSSATSSSLQLKSKKNGANYFSAGSLTFKPQKRPEACREKKQSSRNLKGFETQKTEIPVIGGDIPAVPQNPNLPPLPQLPPLPVPPLPSIPKFPPPLAQKSERTKPEATAGGSKDQKSSILPPIPFLPPIPNPFQPPAVLPPNPLQPPPFLPPNPLLPPPTPLIPNPFQPPPSPLIPNPFQPPPSPMIPLPPIPLVPFPPIPGITPSPPPPPPAFPFPIPPFPGVPPAGSNSQKSPSP